MTQTQNQQNPQRSRQEIEAHLVAKAWKNESFKQELLNNPKSVIAQEFGVEIPKQLNIEVMEEDANTLFITLPMRPDLSGLELSDQELEAVAGGLTPGIAAGVGIIAGLAGAGISGVNASKEW
jgi:hypothetical protein